MENNIALTALRQELDWLKLVINQSMVTYFLQEGHQNNWIDIPLPDISNSDSPYARVVKKLNLDICERLALALSIAPHLNPEILDVFLLKNKTLDRGFTEFGGLSAENYGGFLPTGQTLCFIITVNHPEMRYKLMDLLGKAHAFYKDDILSLTETTDNLPWLSGQFSLNKNWLNYFLTGEKEETDYIASFPAQKMTTALEWEDLILDNSATAKVNEITSWAKYGKILMEDWGLAKKLKPGYKVLFYGQPGTGKTLTAALIGKATGLAVYKTNLTAMVSKYIGETEKKIFKIFETAKHKNWILFFDDTDALFGRYNNPESFTNKQVNQHRAYLLQKIEEYPGIVIVATNLINTVDKTFARKFQTIIHFIMPAAEERYQLWHKAFSGVCKLEENINLHAIAKEYELTGGNIVNVLRYCALSALSRDSMVVTEKELLEGIKREVSVI